MNRITAYIRQSLQESYPQEEIKALSMLICCDMLGLDALDIYMGKDIILSECKQRELENIIFRLQKNEPIQYIRGFAEFSGRNFKVASGVLIPRPDTEVLVDRALTYLKTVAEPRVLDLCAGSGCIGLALAKNAPESHVVLGELDEGALRICRQNIRRNDLTGRVVSLQLDAREKPPAHLGEFDCIVSNPPYIPDGDIAELDASVRDYEPHLALRGGTDGLDFYRAIAGHWTAALRVGGRLLFEVGIGQADEVLRIMRGVGFGDLEITPDLNGIPRVVEGVLCSEL